LKTKQQAAPNPNLFHVLLWSATKPKAYAAELAVFVQSKKNIQLASLHAAMPCKRKNLPTTN